MSSFAEVALIIAMADAMLLAYAAAMSVGRLACLGTSVACGAGLVYFIMPPIFSFHITRVRDGIALAVYALGCLAFMRLTSLNSTAEDTPESPADLDFDKTNPITSICLDDLLTDSFRALIKDLGIPLTAENVELSCSASEAQRVISDLLTPDLITPEVTRISITGGQRPSIRLLNIAVHRTHEWPVDASVCIGRHERQCNSFQVADWPDSIRANWFDNGYSRIYQVTMACGSEHRPSLIRIEAPERAQTQSVPIPPSIISSAPAIYADSSAAR
jgi:hypothetical protein